MVHVAKYNGRWEQVEIRLESGEVVNAIAPLIVSASRATDIPAFHGEWLLNHLTRGFLTWVNPFNGKPVHVSFAKARAIVFWTKNPGPFLRFLDRLDGLFPNYYFLYTLNDYAHEGWEPGVPSLDERIGAFRRLALRIGPERVIWRFDPLVLAPGLDMMQLGERVIRIAERLKGATRRLVVSFVDIECYPKVKRNLLRSGAGCREFTLDEKHCWAKAVSERVRAYGMTMTTCAEETDLREFGIDHGRCIDDRLLRRLFAHDRELMAFLGEEPGRQVGMFGDHDDPRRHPLRDKGQRTHCGCMVSKDIGRYDTCPHQCVYCYANTSAAAVNRGMAAMRGNHDGSVDSGN